MTESCRLPSEKVEKLKKLFCNSQATEKIIVSSSKLINKLENLELLKTPTPPTASVNIELLNEPRPAYEIFGNLEHLILFSDDDDDFFMPVVDGEFSDDLQGFPSHPIPF